MGREDEVKLIAYKIWEEESCPDGYDCEHWFRAEAIWEQREKQKAATKSTKTASGKNIKKNTRFMSAKKK